MRNNSLLLIAAATVALAACGKSDNGAAKAAMTRPTMPMLR